MTKKNEEVRAQIPMSLLHEKSDLLRQTASIDSLPKECGRFPVFRVPPDARPITLDDVRRDEDEP